MKRINHFFLIITVFASVSSLIAQKKNLVSEREIIALLELQERTSGHQWKNKWDRSLPIDQWYGVTVKDGKVIGLDLSDNNLSGTIPLTIGNLKNLQTLDLSNNELEGKMPRLFRKLKDLKTFNVANNNFEGQLPNTLDKLVSLEELNVVGNQLEGEVPAAIVQLQNLKTLAVADNMLSGNLPDGMNNLKKLNKIYLANNNFASMDNLRSLARQQTIFTDVDVNSKEFKPFNLEKMTKEGLSKLEFQD